MGPTEARTSGEVARRVVLLGTIEPVLPFLFVGILVVGDAPFWAITDNLRQAALIAQDLALGIRNPAVRGLAHSARRILVAALSPIAGIMVLSQLDKEVRKMVAKKIAKGLVSGTASLIHGTIDGSADVAAAGYGATKDSVRGVARNAEKLVKKILE
jgi:hypothetical protein